MHHYMLNIVVFTFAMIGLIFFALLVYKKVSDFGVGTRPNSKLKVLDMLRISPSKAFYVISTGSEKFLVASDTNSTNLISKIDGNDYLE